MPEDRRVQKALKVYKGNKALREFLDHKVLRETKETA
jgi:hypothetical protein